MSEEKRYRANPDYIVRQIAGEYLLVEVSENGASQNKMMMFNETGNFIWEELQEALTIEELVDRASTAFQIADQNILEQITEFVLDLIEHGLIIEEENEE